MRHYTLMYGAPMCHMDPAMAARPRSVAREGALDNLSPALCAGIVAAKAAPAK